ncbi:MAG: hypothetical protein HY313_11320 [Acidobacteria bacterium]|nr:hypothetical protein [Acidobacteriota bacterium]
MQPERKKASLFVAMTFLCGALTGAVATNLWVKTRSSVSVARADAPAEEQQRSREQRIKRSVEWFTEELNLSSEQASQLTQILDETRNAYRIEEKRIESIREQSRNRIREILNAEQRAKYDEIRTRQDRKRGSRR